MSKALRDYQERGIEQMRTEFRAGKRTILYRGETGSGKTLLTAHMLGAVADKKNRSWFIVHRRELIRQSTDAFTGEGIDHGVVAAGKPMQPSKMVQVCGIQSLVNRLHLLEDPKFIVWDECHHLGARSWETIFKRYPKAFHVGLTATPARLDGKGLGKFFQTMIEGPDSAWLIANKYLSDYRFFAPGNIDTSNVSRRAGDFVRSELAAAADKPTITGCALTEYRRHAPGEPAIGFCVSIEHSQHVAAAFRAAGYRALHLDGETPSDERDEAIEKFRKGELDLLFNVDLFGEGFDVPNVRCVLDLAPTLSLARARQRWGRALRPASGKDYAIILDFAGNADRHGLPDDKIEWTLSDRPKRQSLGSDGPRVRVCPKCSAALPSWVGSCRWCGWVFPRLGGRQVEERDGDLVEVDRARVKADRARKVAMARTTEDLIRVGRELGHKYPVQWAYHVQKARQAKRMGGGR